MSNKFDLERFKAGEVAIDDTGDEFHYVGTLPNGEIVFGWEGKFGWKIDYWSLSALEKCTMKPKEEWSLVKKSDAFNWSFVANVYSSKEAALEAAKKSGSAFYYELEAVKIIRE